MKLIAGWLFLSLSVFAIAAETPSPALLVLNKGGSLAIVDPATNKVVGRVPTGAVPHEVAVSEDGRLAFTSNYGDAGADNEGRTISVIGLASQKELRRVELGPLHRPHGLAFAGGELYFTVEMSKLIARYDPQADRVDWYMGTGQNRTHMIEVSKDRKTIYTSNVDSGTISIFDKTEGPDRWVQTVVPAGKGPEGFDVTPDGKQLWAAGSGDGLIHMIDLGMRKETGTIDIRTKRSNRLRFTPDGAMALISDLAAGDVVVVDVASRKERKRVHVGTNVAGILIRPDGKQAYVACTGDNQVAILDLQTFGVTGRIQTGKGPDGMAWVVATHQ
jgi:YVTN family beta-propeller protein